jgi:hypothetical protein
MSSRTRHIITYVTASVLLVAGILFALAFHRTAKANRAAEDKADQLIASLQSDGLAAPAKDQIIRVLGDDGGLVCADPGNALIRAALLGVLDNGAGGPGQRPVIADRKVVRGGLRIVQIYCPEKLDEARDLVDDLKLSGDEEG